MVEIQYRSWEMAHTSRQFSVPHLPCNRVSNVLLWPSLGYVVEYTRFQPNTLLSNYHTSTMKSICPSYTYFSSLPRVHYSTACQIDVELRETAKFGRFSQSKFCVDSSENQTFNEEVDLGGSHSSPESNNDQGKRRRVRKRKHGNKGSIPWNKGKNHTAETRALIRQRTIEALRDPQVRKKMSQHPRAHSEENKAKIKSALRKHWAKRLKWERLKEKFFLSWAKSVAGAAKKGGSDQEVLDWDSYDKIKEAHTLKYLKCNMKKVRAKELKNRKVERAVKEKAETMVRLALKTKETVEKAEKAAERKEEKAAIARKRKEQEDKAKEHARAESTGKSKRNSREFSLPRELTLKQRLTKIRKGKSIDGRVILEGESTISSGPAWEKLDIDLIRREKVEREVSLADQIQAAKNKRVESLCMEALATPSTVHSLGGRSLRQKYSKDEVLDFTLVA